MSENQHSTFMAQAILEAKKAYALEEVPVGAVVVLNGEIIGRGFNQPISSHDPSAHAEVMALRDAAKNIKNYRLKDCDLYVTIEPCTMCSGAMVHARIKRLIFAALEPKAGVVVSQGAALEEDYINHKIDVIRGVLEEECSALMQDFFKMRRSQKKEQKIKARALKKKEVLAELLVSLQQSMEGAQIWSEIKPTTEALKSIEPFCVDTLNFEQWLQFVMIPTFELMMARNMTLPEVCDIAPMAAEAFKSRAFPQVVSAIKAIDKLLTKIEAK